MIDYEDLKGFSKADEEHQREWREWLEKTFDKDGNLKEDSVLNEETPTKVEKTKTLKSENNRKDVNLSF